jgi:hypothetical protein
LTDVFGLRALARLLGVAMTATMVLLVSSVAHAAVVPMCGEDAQSVAAPAIIFPGKGHVLERVPCPEQDLFQLDRDAHEGQRIPSSAPDDGPQRVQPAALSFPRLPRVARQAVATETFEPQRGCLASIERPPRQA